MKLFVVNTISDQFPFINFSIFQEVPAEFCEIHNCSKRKSRFRHEGVEISKNITEKTAVKIQFSTEKLSYVFALRPTVTELETSEIDERGIVQDFFCRGARISAGDFCPHSTAHLSRTARAWPILPKISELHLEYLFIYCLWVST